ncbi:phospholipid methyltransferase [Roseimicrobium gellanilyticum]|uniref:Phospholipid methyltransferase n=1 Tax=Roseimicrobium gellanilyticum TaxID=748857 RepID=A0A366H8P7_9BACT|nr:isoprenylcysteine carboxylmethyltransferase family protein [Roseimicrobium gellanilyticum]RBP38600.1 phospholipid methyltransferase [Roseimicrobium gellanilyticum]
MKDLLMAVFGLYLVLASIKGRIWCMLYIGGRKTETLVVDGPYARSRNPLYYYSAMGVVGISFASGMLSIVAVMSLLFAASYPFVIWEEEKRLLSIHGERYRRYCEMVPRFWPRRDVRGENRRHEFVPSLFHKAFWDAVGFLVGWLLVAGTHFMHAIESLPRWMRFV